MRSLRDRPEPLSSTRPLRSMRCSSNQRSTSRRARPASACSGPAPSRPSRAAGTAAARVRCRTACSSGAALRSRGARRAPRAGCASIGGGALAYAARRLAPGAAQAGPDRAHLALGDDIAVEQLQCGRGPRSGAQSRRASRCESAAPGRGRVDTAGSQSLPQSPHGVSVKRDRAGVELDALERRRQPRLYAGGVRTKARPNRLPDSISASGIML